MMHPANFLFLAGLATAATTSSFCSGVSAKKCSSSGTAYCSSYLKVPVATTTVTTTKTITGTFDATVTSGTSTARTTEVVPRSTTATTTITSLSTATTTSYSTTVTVTSTDYELPPDSTFVGGCTFAATARGKRAAAATTTSALAVPPCLTGYPSASLSSACSCLSIPKSTTTSTSTFTATTRITRTTTVPSATTTLTARTLSPTTVSTSTLTLSSTATTTLTASGAATSTLVVPPPKPFGIRLESQGNGWLNDGGLQFSASSNAAIFTLEPSNSTASAVNCVLTYGGVQAVVTGANNDLLTFAGAPADYRYIVRCYIDPGSSRVFCRSPKTGVYSGGFVDGRLRWHIPPTADKGTAYVDVPGGIGFS